MTRQIASLALCAALMSAAAAPALARPTHRCVTRVPHGCPNQHPIVHGPATLLGPHGLRGHGHKVNGITVTKQTGAASPTLYQRAQ